MTKMSSEIADILNRYKTLKDVNLQLIEAQSSAELTKESQQRELSFFSKAGANTILNNNNDISKLKELLEREHTEVLVTQSSMDKNLVESSAKTLELGQILSSIANMLSRCEESFRVRHNKPARLLEKTEGLSVGEQCAITMAMLEELGLFMVDFQSLVKEDAVMKADLAASLAY